MVQYHFKNKKEECMKATIELIEKQDEVLTNVIRWLDHMKFSNTRIREDVDQILNHSEQLREDSKLDLTKIQLL
tara:strand:- start:63 stop:284 length:222 start_codon:yes stop_codon:yes gene_type:complete